MSTSTVEIEAALAENVSVTADTLSVELRPTIENRLWLRCAAVFNRLPELSRTVREWNAILVTRESEEG